MWLALKNINMCYEELDKMSVISLSLKILKKNNCLKYIYVT
jgi:hypothetical protein